MAGLIKVLPGLLNQSSLSILSFKSLDQYLEGLT